MIVTCEMLKINRCPLCVAASPNVKLHVILKIKENKMTAKISMFFVHCLGLQDLNNDRAKILILKLGLFFSNFRN